MGTGLETRWDVDPVKIKFLQLIGAEIFGAILSPVGLYMFFRGITGKSDLIVEGKGVKAKLTNSAPGTIICLIGVALIVFSLHSSSVTREESGLSPEHILETWTANSYKVTEAMDVEQVIDTIVGKGENVRFTNTEITLKTPATLGEISRQELEDRRYWHIIAAINKDRHYYVLSRATEATELPSKSLVQIWHVSKYNGLDSTTRIQVSNVDRAHGYDELLALANAGRPYGEAFSDESFKHFHQKELDLSLEYVTPGDVHNLRELSLKLYGDPKYWPIIVWANRDQFPEQVSEGTSVSPDQKLSAPQFTPWPR
jgi:hypothetical protein